MKKHHYINTTLHNRLLLYFVLFALIPILLVGITSYIISVSVTKRTAIQFSKQIVNHAVTEIEDIVLDTYKICDIIADDPHIQEVLRKPLFTDKARRYSVDLAIDTRLNYISTYKDELFGFYVVGENGGKYKSNYTSIKDIDLRDSAWYQEVIKRGEPIWFGTHVDSFATETSGELLISLGFPIKDKASGRISGVILVDIEEDMMSTITNSQLGDSGYMFILDEDNYVISHPNRYLITQKVDIDIDNYSELENDETNYYTNSLGEKYIIVYKTLPSNSWKIVALVPMDELTKDSKKIESVIGVSLIIICLLALLVAWNIAGRMIVPIRKMILLMKKVEKGDLSVVMDVDNDDEIGQLSKSFNIMIQKLHNLMNKVRQEQKELRKSELKALQSQINPHFLYNTLDSIIWMARANRNDDIIKIVTAVTKLFRIGISRGKDIISIQEEIDHVRNYLIILHIRYGNKFSYDINVPESIYKYMSLKLLLQPIVENAIYHGIKLKREKGHILITAKEDNENIFLIVEDTGAGMNSEQLHALRNTLNNINGEKLDSYGLRNVNERIKIFFGSEYGLSIYSESGVGTRVEINIPKLLEGE